MSGFEWLPPDISAAFFVILVLTSFCTSALTGAFGLGGGMLMLVVMSMGLPMATVVPLHGIVQLGSNTSRSFIQRRHIDRSLFLWFALGSLLGVLAGGAVVISIPDALLKILLAVFILWTVFGRKQRLSTLSRRWLVGGGFLTGLASMFVGATGPLVAAVLSAGKLQKHALVATQAASMVAQHGLKVLLFGGLGFAYGSWALLLVLMIGAGYLGVYAGSQLLERLPERYFETGFKTIMVIACMQLLWSALRDAGVLGT